jgi:L-asparaginase
MAHYLVINTGGTIGMQETQSGLAPKSGLIRETMENHAELSEWRAHTLSWIEWSPLLDSSDLHPSHWYQLRNDILNHETVDGVLIVHGTDTLSYTASALSFLLNDLNIPVVISGSMKPIGDTKTDAIKNLNIALHGLASNRTEVMVAVGKLLPASRVTKFSTQQMEAFIAPGWKPLHWQTQFSEQLTISKPFQEQPISVFTLHPGVQYDLLEYMIESDFRAILINALGNGNAANDEAFKALLKRAKEKNIPIFVRSQCVEGSVDFGLYAASSLFSDAGAISAGTMTMEAALAKLQILCSEFDDAEKVIDWFHRPVAREWQVLN